MEASIGIELYGRDASFRLHTGAGQSTSGLPLVSLELVSSAAQSSNQRICVEASTEYYQTTSRTSCVSLAAGTEICCFRTRVSSFMRLYGVREEIHVQRSCMGG